MKIRWPASRHFGPFAMNEDEFDAAVQAAIARIPAELRAQMDNVAIFIAEDYMPGPGEDPDTVLLGLYEGTAADRTRIRAGIGITAGPDHHLPPAHPGDLHQREEVIHEVTVTVTHEIAHHFGIDDERLHDLGWG